MIWIYCRSWSFHWEFSGNVVKRLYSRSNCSVFLFIRVCRAAFFWHTIQLNGYHAYSRTRKIQPFRYSNRWEMGKKALLWSFGNCEGARRRGELRARELSRQKKEQMENERTEKWRRRPHRRGKCKHSFPTTLHIMHQSAGRAHIFLISRTLLFCARWPMFTQSIDHFY